MHIMQLILNNFCITYQRLLLFKYCNLYVLCVLSCVAWIFGVQKTDAANDLAPSQQRYELVVSKAADIVLPLGAVSIVIGDPEIADILVQNGASLIVSGKRIGQTNMLVRDHDQNLLLDLQLDVIAPDHAALTVHRGANKTEYDCKPICRAKAQSADRSAPQSSNPPSVSP